LLLMNRQKMPMGRSAAPTSSPLSPPSRLMPQKTRSGRSARALDRIRRGVHDAGDAVSSLQDNILQAHGHDRLIPDDQDVEELEGRGGHVAAAALSAWRSS